MNPLDSCQTLTKSKALDYLEIQFQERGGNAANKDRKNLLAAWNWGIAFKGLPKDNPFDVPKFPEKRHPRYVPPEEDFWKVFNLTEGQDRVMLLCYLHLAARRTEIFKLKVDDVDFRNRQVRLWTRKRKGGTLEPDWLPMTDELHDALAFHLDGWESTWVFLDPERGSRWTSRRKWMKGLCKRAGVKPFGIHAIRHLAASILGGAGHPAMMIQRLLRHKKVSTTEVYLHHLGMLGPVIKTLSGRHPPLPTPKKLKKVTSKVTSIDEFRKRKERATA